MRVKARAPAGNDPVRLDLERSDGWQRQRIGVVSWKQAALPWGTLILFAVGIALGTGTFQARDVMRSGIVITVIGYAPVLLPTATWWDWIGHVKGWRRSRSPWLTATSLALCFCEHLHPIR